MIYDALKTAIETEQPVAVATLIGGTEPVGAKLLVREDGTTLGSLGAGLPEQDVIRDALALLAQHENAVRSYATASGELDVFIESYPPPPVMFIVGAVHIAIGLVTFAKTLGFRAVVVDARGAFATAERFAHVDELVLAWPDEALAGRLTSNSHVVLLTHDPKLDDPAILLALRSPARYIGALGSPKTHAARLERLRAEGISDEQLARLYAPVGLPIGARTPEEIAVSIIAEIVAARHGRTEGTKEQRN